MLINIVSNKETQLAFNIQEGASSRWPPCCCSPLGYLPASDGRWEREAESPVNGGNILATPPVLQNMMQDN